MRKRGRERTEAGGVPLTFIRYAYIVLHWSWCVISYAIVLDAMCNARLYCFTVILHAALLPSLTLVSHSNVLHQSEFSLKDA